MRGPAFEEQEGNLREAKERQIGNAPHTASASVTLLSRYAASQIILAEPTNELHAVSHFQFMLFPLLLWHSEPGASPNMIRRDPDYRYPAACM